MSEKKILVVHTTGDWWESRYHFKQIPALRNAGYIVYHLIKLQETTDSVDGNFIKVSPKYIRVTGGLSILRIILKSKINVIQICNIETLPLGIFLSIFFRKIVFYDCIEDHKSSLLYSKPNMSRISRIIISNLVVLFEKIAQLTFRGIITSDPYIYHSFKIIRNHKKMLFYNMPALRDFKNISCSQKKYDLVVLGSMSIRTGVLDVLRALIELRKEKVFANLKLIGDPYLDKELGIKLNEMRKDMDIFDYVKVTGKIPFYQVPNELIECRIGIIPLLDLPKFNNNIAMKQWEYWALGLPVIASRLGPQHYFLIENYNGLFYEPGNIDDLKTKILELIRNCAKIEELGINGLRKINSEWNSENQEAKLINFYNLRLKNLEYFENELPRTKII
jgi:glycosyltransferase involved in cell wall biosynthesis